MKRPAVWLMILIFMCSAKVFYLDANALSAEVYKEFYVDATSGSDLNNGSAAAPFKTIQKAVEEVRKVNSGMDKDIVVNIKSGRYEISQSIDFRQEDSGKNGHRVIYKGIGSKKPTISGAKRIEEFTVNDDGIWQADVDLEFVRELSVNGVMAQIARSENKIYGLGPYNPQYSENTTLTEMDGIYVSKSDLGLYENPSDISFKWDFAHASALMKVTNIKQDPENDDRVIVEFKKPVWNSVCIKEDADVYSAPLTLGWQVAFSVENAYELLDTPGEFYYNKQEKILYYYPREGENVDTAEVLCPQADKLITVSGRGYFNKLTNISFENIEFAHTTWDYLDDFSLYFYQAESPKVNYAPETTTPGAFEVDWADGLNVINCDFYGITTAALKFHDGVINSKVRGNTFADIGCGAILVGTKQHDLFSAPASVESGEANVFFKKGWSASSEPPLTSLLINYQYNSDSATSNYTWTNEYELSQNPEALSWVKADLGKAYDISQIKMQFKNTAGDSHSFTTQEKSNFEVLVSNDRTFKTFKRIREVGTNTSSTLYINEDLSERYRYIMFRKTEAEPFAITCIWVYSGDEDVQRTYRMGLCVQNTISDNYITRIGRLHTGAPAITAYYTEGLIVTNNEISDIPYSGISLGWGWNSENSTAKNNVISNNIISDYMKMCNDGGGIYVLGSNPGTKIFGNYLKDGLNGYGAIYLDTGSVGFNLYENVADNTNSAVFQVDGQYSKDINIRDTYTTFGDVEPYKGSVSATDPNYTVRKALISNALNSTVEDAVAMRANRYLPEAFEIVAKAGLSNEYKDIKQNVADNANALYEGPYASYGNGRKAQREYSDYTNAYKRSYYYQAQLVNILENGSFGNEEWQYPQEYKKHIENILMRVSQRYNYKVVGNTTPQGYWCRGAHIDEMYMMKALVEKLENSAHHLSADEMIARCDEYLADAEEGKSFGKYKSGSINELNSVLADVKDMPKNTDVEKYKCVYMLEEALDKFISQKYSDEIIGAYVSGGKTEIDLQTKTVTISLPFGADINTIIPTFYTVGDTEVSIIDNVKLNTYLKLRCFNSEINASSEYWRLLLKYGTAQPASISEGLVNGDNWFNSNRNVELKSAGNSMLLSPWLYPYMYRNPANGNVDFSIKADRADCDFGISFILSAKVCEDLEYDGCGEYKNTYYRLSLVNQRINLYRVTSGSEEFVGYVDDVGFVYGEYNDFSAEIKEISGKDYLTLNLNRKNIFDSVEVGKIEKDGYFGVLTKSVPVEIAETVYEKAHIDAKFTISKNYIDVTVDKETSDTYKMITAFYDEGGLLVSIEKCDLSESDKRRFYVPGKTQKVVVYLLDFENGVKPVCRVKEIYK